MAKKINKKVKISPKYTAKMSSYKLKKIAGAAEIVAKEEYKLKEKCVLREILVMKESLASYPLQTPLAPPAVIQKSFSIFRVGDYVSVAPDFFIGKIFHGGIEWILDVKGSGPGTNISVQYKEYSASLGIGRKFVVKRVTIVPLFSSIPCNKRYSRGTQQSPFFFPSSDEEEITSDNN